MVGELYWMIVVHSGSLPPSKLLFLVALCSTIVCASCSENRIQAGKRKKNVFLPLEIVMAGGFHCVKDFAVCCTYLWKYYSHRDTPIRE